MKNIFQNSYNRDSYVNLLGGIFKSSFEAKQNPPTVEFSNHIAEQAYFLGNITLQDGNEIAVYETLLRDNCYISRNKIGIRNLLKNSWKGYDGAFIASYQTNTSDWRFSFISETRGFNEDGNYGIQRTQAKRYTYILGDDHPCRTASERFEKLEKEDKTLSKIKDAFSVEALDKDFFRDYKKQYEIFCNYIYENKANKELFGEKFSKWEDKTIRDYVKKLLGRIVFLYFLQKKEWMCGDINYMKNLFVKSNEKDNYLDKVLEPLFFGVLNTKPEDRKELFISEGWDTELLKEWNEIPYLNGGLFEQEEIDKPKTVFSKDLFANLFDLFSSYNFTIDENDPNDTEVGVDPEMLGKIFENLLEDNNDKGAFYTPKEIVQFMCKESLISYLSEKNREITEIDLFLDTHQRPQSWSEQNKKQILKSLTDVTICDPAIGSGAFPMGILNELYKCRLALGESQSSEIKKQIIQNNIYGVDIEKGAVDIARLRFWLALVVDETNPHPLPNLDYKIMQGNSLLESFEGVDLSNIYKKKG